MPPLPPAAVIKVVPEFAIPTGKPIVNIFHVGYTGGGPSLATLTAWAALMDPLIDSFLTTFMHTSVDHAATTYTDLGTSTGATLVTNPSTGGGNVGTIAPMNVAAVVSWKISRRYRGGHPRTYVGGLSDSQLNDPYSIDPTFQGNLNTAADVFNFAVAGTSGTLPGATLVCVSYFNGHAVRVAPLIEPITSAIVHHQIRTQRRRIEL